MSQNTITNVKHMSPYWNLNEAEEDEAFCLAASLVTEGVKFGVLKAMQDLKVFEIIQKCGPSASLSAAEIVAELPTTNSGAAVAALGRMLDLLVSHSVLTVTPIDLSDGTVQRRYGLAPACKFLMPNEDGVCLSPGSNVSVYKAMIESSFFLKDAVLDGVQPFTKAHGISFYENFDKQRESSEEFQEGMSHHSILIMSKILTKNTRLFEGISTLVDVGGGNGTALNMILSKHPTIKGINFDQPFVVANAPSYPGVEHVGGDMLDNIPKGDAIFLKWICHNFSDELCIKILKNCYAALPEGRGKVLICEGVRPGPKESTSNFAAQAILQFDVVMMATSGGKERTEKDFKALASAAGFTGFKVVCTAYDAKLMELVKKN